MDSPTRLRVHRALDALTPFLATFVEQRVSAARGANRSGRADMQASLRTMTEQWDRAFAEVLPKSVRHYVKELSEVRTRWANEAPFPDGDARRAIEATIAVAEAIGAPATLLETLRELATPEATAPKPTPAARKPATRKAAAPKLAAAKAGATKQAAAKPAAPRTDPNAPESPAIRRDVNGVIINAAELTADDVALQRVLCPACERKVFKSWPLGWDAHAAHPCPGVAMGNDAERKAEYRRRYKHLFRDEGKAEQPDA